MTKKELLEKGRNERKMFELYSIQDAGAFSVGIPLKLYENDFLISRISKDGQGSGVEATRYEDVIVLKEQTNYLKRLERIDPQSNVIIDFCSDNAIAEVLAYSCKHQMNVEIVFFDPFEDAVYGRCISFDGNLVGLEEINTKGNKDGIAYIEIDDIRSCFCE